MKRSCTDIERERKKRRGCSRNLLGLEHKLVAMANKDFLVTSVVGLVTCFPGLYLPCHLLKSYLKERDVLLDRLFVSFSCRLVTFLVWPRHSLLVLALSIWAWVGQLVFDLMLRWIEQCWSLPIYTFACDVMSAGKYSMSVGRVGRDAAYL